MGLDNTIKSEHCHCPKSSCKSSCNRLNHSTHNSRIWPPRETEFSETGPVPAATGVRLSWAWRMPRTLESGFFVAPGVAARCSQHHVNREPTRDLLGSHFGDVPISRLRVSWLVMVTLAPLIDPLCQRYEYACEAVNTWKG